MACFYLPFLHSSLLHENPKSQMRGVFSFPQGGGMWNWLTPNTHPVANLKNLAEIISNPSAHIYILRCYPWFTCHYELCELKEKWTMQDFSFIQGRDDSQGDSLSLTLRECSEEAGRLPFMYSFWLRNTCIQAYVPSKRLPLISS